MLLGDCQPGAIGREGQRSHNPRPEFADRLERGRLVRSAHIPGPNHAIGRHGNQAQTGGMESNGGDGSGVGPEDGQRAALEG